MWRFVTGSKPPPDKKAKLSGSAANSNYEKEKRKRKPQESWKVNRPWLKPEGLICTYCVDAFASTQNVNSKTEFIKGCKSTRIESVKKHETSERATNKAVALTGFNLFVMF